LPTSTRSGGGSILEGVHEGIQSGWFMGEIAESAYRFEREVNAGERIVVGVNAFTRAMVPRVQSC
jgi:methylmalonyl-CoA mutase N-terminal domain/subunit